MRFYIRTRTTTGATAFETLDAAVHQARATLKLAGARSLLQVLAHMLERGDIEELHRTISQQGRQIKVVAGLAPQKRRH